METGEVSDKLGRGRHTTRHAELFPIEDGGGYAGRYARIFYAENNGSWY